PSRRGPGARRGGARAAYPRAPRGGGDRGAALDRAHRTRARGAPRRAARSHEENGPDPRWESGPPLADPRHGETRIGVPGDVRIAVGAVWIVVLVVGATIGVVKTWAGPVVTGAVAAPLVRTPPTTTVPVPIPPTPPPTVVPPVVPPISMPVVAV